MVVSYATTMPASTQRQTVKHVGNKTKILLDDNANDLILVGNRTRVEIEENRGSIKVVGDNGVVIVLRNSGVVRYVGNGGTIIIGNESTSRDVKSTGNGAVLKYCDGADIERTKSDRTNKRCRSRKDSLARSSRLYHSDSELSASSILNDCNEFLSKIPVNLEYRSMDCFVVGDPEVSRHGISVVNGNIVINNSWS